MSKRLRDHLRSNLVGYLGVFLALSGTAYATHPGGDNTIDSGDIINSQVRTADVGNNQVRTLDVRDDTLAGGGLAAADLAPASVASSELATNAVPNDGVGDDGSTKLATDSVDFLEIQANAVRSFNVQSESLTGSDITGLTGADITDGSVGAADLSAAALGARAYGRVSATGVLTRSKNVTSVSHPDNGLYCIDPASGIDVATAVLIVGPDRNGNGTDSVAENVSVVSWESTGGACPAGTLKVLTNVYNGDATDDDDGGGNTIGDDLLPDDEPFAFTIP